MTSVDLRLLLKLAVCLTQFKNYAAHEHEENGMGDTKLEENSAEPGSQPSFKLEWKKSVVATDDFWREVNVTKEKVYYRGYTLPDDICKMKQATRRTGLAPRTVLPQLFRMFNSLFSIFKILNTGFRTFFDILKIGKDILNLIGIRKRDDVVLFDKMCRSCRLWMTCFNIFKRHPWAEIGDDEGGILKFSTFVPHDWNLIGIGNWKCTFKLNNKMRTYTVFGGQAPKRAVSLIRISETKIEAVNPETKKKTQLMRPYIGKNTSR